MAIIKWTGATSGDWTTVTNWDGGALPVTGDSVVVPKAGVTNAMSSNLDRSGDGAGAGLNLVEFHVEENATSAVGSSGTPLELTADLIIHRGQGAFYFKCNTGTDNDVTDKIVVNSRNNVDAFSADGSASITRIHVLKGKVTVKSSLTAMTSGYLELSYDTNPSSDAIVVVEEGGPTIPNVLMAGGQLDCKAVVTLGTITGGQWTQDVEEVVDLLINGNAKVIYNSPSATGDATTIAILRGTLDATQAQKSKDLGIVKVFPGGVYLRDLGLLVNTTEEVMGSGFASTTIGSGQLG